MAIAIFECAYLITLPPAKLPLDPLRLPGEEWYPWCSANLTTGLTKEPPWFDAGKTTGGRRAVVCCVRVPADVEGVWNNASGEVGWVPP